MDLKIQVDPMIRQGKCLVFYGNEWISPIELKNGTGDSRTLSFYMMGFPSDIDHQVWVTFFAGRIFQWFNAMLLVSAAIFSLNQSPSCVLRVWLANFSDYWWSTSHVLQVYHWNLHMAHCCWPNISTSASQIRFVSSRKHRFHWYNPHV